jgi:hypothetical protein
MSVKVMGLVWERSRASGSDLLVLLAIADNAHDDGAGAWPSIDTLAFKTRLSRRNVQYVLKHLEALGELSVERGRGRKHVNSYAINVQALHLYPDREVQPSVADVQPGAEKVQPSVGKGAIAIAPKPSRTIIEPSDEPSVSTTRAHAYTRETHDAIFDAILRFCGWQAPIANGALVGRAKAELLRIAERTDVSADALPALIDSATRTAERWEPQMRTPTALVKRWDTLTQTRTKRGYTAQELSQQALELRAQGR